MNKSWNFCIINTPRNIYVNKKRCHIIFLRIPENLNAYYNNVYVTWAMNLNNSLLHIINMYLRSHQMFLLAQKQIVKLCLADEAHHYIYLISSSYTYVIIQTLFTHMYTLHSLHHVTYMNTFIRSRINSPKWIENFERDERGKWSSNDEQIIWLFHLFFFIRTSSNKWFAVFTYWFIQWI